MPQDSTIYSRSGVHELDRSGLMPEQDISHSYELTYGIMNRAYMFTVFIFVYTRLFFFIRNCLKLCIFASTPTHF